MTRFVEKMTFTIILKLNSMYFKTFNFRLEFSKTIIILNPVFTWYENLEPNNSN